MKEEEKEEDKTEVKKEEQEKDEPQVPLTKEEEEKLDELQKKDYSF